MQKRHKNKWQYFNEQAYTTKKYIIPYIEQQLQLCKGATVLEIGCGEGGNLLPFVDMGCKVIGIDISKGKIDKGNEFYSTHKSLSNLTLIADNVYNRNDLGKFDLIILRDVIEHIPNQEYFMEYFKCFFHSKTVVFFGFPPWQNPFGGHQQICHNRFLSKLPYFHLLPAPLYKGILKLFREPDSRIKNLLEIKETGISIERFMAASRMQNFRILDRTLFLVNPNYEVKFKLKPRRQLGIITSIPGLRNIFSTCAYFLLSANNLG